MQNPINISEENADRRDLGGVQRCLATEVLRCRARSIRSSLLVLSFCLIAQTAAVTAQNKPVAKAAAANPLSTTNKNFYEGMKGMLLLSAQKVPEEHYNFKPTDAVRTYGQIIGHLADSYYSNCALVLGEKRPAFEVEKTKAKRADLIEALKASFSYCDKAYNGMTDAAAVQTVNFMGADTTKMGVLTANLIHSGLHYGNLVTYMRLKNIVPPTSDPGLFEPQKQ